MSDAEQKDMLTRKSNRQKTPNLYYKQEISEIRTEPKAKALKPNFFTSGQGVKAQKSKKKVIGGGKRLRNSEEIERYGEDSLFFDGSEQVMQVERNPNSSRHASFRMEESNPASDAPEDSEHLADSPSISDDDESKKSNLNNPNNSGTENEVINGTGISSKTRKIRKKPRFSDEMYLDNVSIQKFVPKKAQVIKDGGKKKQNSLMQDLQDNVTPLDRQGKPSKAQMKAQSKKERQFEEKIKDVHLTADNKNAVTGVQVQQGKPKAIEEQSQQKNRLQSNPNVKNNTNSSYSNQHPQNTSNTSTTAQMSLNTSSQAQIDFNTSSILNLFTSAMVKNVPSSNSGLPQLSGGQGIHNNQGPSHSSIANLKQKSTSIEQFKRRQAAESPEEVSTTTKKKFKSGSKASSDGELRRNFVYGMNSSFNKQICDGSSILHNGTVYNFPNITSNNECITRVDRLSDKFILHHSTLAPMEVNRIFLKEEVKRKVNLSSIISSITLQQIAQQQRESSHCALQRIAKTIDSSKISIKKENNSAERKRKIGQTVNKEVKQSQNLHSKQQSSPSFCGMDNSLLTKTPQVQTNNSVTQTQQQQLLHQQQQLNLFASVPQAQYSLPSVSLNGSITEVKQPNLIQYALQQLQQQINQSNETQHSASTQSEKPPCQSQDNEEICENNIKICNDEKNKDLKSSNQPSEFDETDKAILQEKHIYVEQNDGQIETQELIDQEKQIDTIDDDQSICPRNGNQDLQKEEAQGNEIETRYLNKDQQIDQQLNNVQTEQITQSQTQPNKRVEKDNIEQEVPQDNEVPKQDCSQNNIIQEICMADLVDY